LLWMGFFLGPLQGCDNHPPPPKGQRKARDEAGCSGHDHGHHHHHHHPEILPHSHHVQGQFSMQDDDDELLDKILGSEPTDKDWEADITSLLDIPNNQTTIFHRHLSNGGTNCGTGTPTPHDERQLYEVQEKWLDPDSEHHRHLQRILTEDTKYPIKTYWHIMKTGPTLEEGEYYDSHIDHGMYWLNKKFENTSFEFVHAGTTRIKKHRWFNCIHDNYERGTSSMQVSQLNCVDEKSILIFSISNNLALGY